MELFGVFDKNEMNEADTDMVQLKRQVCFSCSSYPRSNSLSFYWTQKTSKVKIAS